VPSRLKAGIKNEKQAFQSFADALRESVRFPNINNYKPHEKQQMFHESHAPKRQFVGGNRSGKSFAGAAEAIWYGKGEHLYKRLPWDVPTRGRIVTVDFKQGWEKIIKPLLQALIPKTMLIDGSWDRSFNKDLHTLTLDNGAFIEIMSYEQELDKFAGTSRHWIWFDEEPPKEIFTECMLRLLDTEGHWWMTMTPVEGMTWTYDDIYSRYGIDPYLFVVEVDMDDNPYLTTEGKELALSGLSQEDLDARKHGKYISIGGLIYPEFDQYKHVIEPTGTPPGWLRFDMMDSGLRNPTAWLFACVDREGTVIILDEHYEAGRIVSHHAKIVKEKDESFGAPAYRVGDPSIVSRNPVTGTSIQLEYVFNGVPIIPGNNDVSAGILRLKTYLSGSVVEGSKSPKLYICRNCVNLIWEMRKYRWKRWAHKQLNYERNRPEEPVKKDDHACDALRYGIASRPETDDGAFVPATHPNYGSEAVELDKPVIDREITLANRKYADYNLGEDY
jgi:phage terminase large subunit-like protein